MADKKGDKPNLALALAMIAEAERKGLHSSHFTVVCEACRQWCDGHYHVLPDRKRICRACAIKMGVKDAK